MSEIHALAERLAADPAVTRSPSAMVRFRADLELHVTRIVDEAVARFLADVLAEARASGSAMGYATVESYWALAVDEGIAADGLDPTDIETPTVRASLLATDLPARVFGAALAVFAAAAAEQWTAEQLDRALAIVLSPGGWSPGALDLVQLAAGAVNFYDTLLARADARAEDRAAGVVFGWAAAAAAIAVTAATGILAVLVDYVAPDENVRWVSRHDSRVRSAHAAADGQTVRVGSMFSVGGELLAYPGDRRGSPGNTINCRCVLVSVRSR